MEKQIISTIKTYIIVILALISFISIDQIFKYKEIVNKLERDKELLEIEIRDLTREEIDISYAYPSKVELKPGKHTVGGIKFGDSINAGGTYKVYAKKGYGLLTGNLYQGYISKTIGYSSHKGYEETCEVYLSKDDEFTIEGNCILVFEPVK